MTTASRATTLRDIFTIPEHTGTDDYVLRLSASVADDQVAQTLADYVLTPALVTAFEQALALIQDAVRTGKNRAAFLEGSFGSGKSHFMAVLHAILANHPAARAMTGLQPVLDRYAGLTDKKFLRLTFHFLDSDTVESTLFRQYLEQVTALHPGAPLPVLHSAGRLFDDAQGLRERLGDDAFLAGLRTETTACSGLFAQLGIAPKPWTGERYDAAAAADAPVAERQALQRALIAGYFNSYSRNSDWLPLEEGLQAISEHAKSLGYDAVVLLLDELILWLTFLLTEHARLNAEVQKITKLVEDGRGLFPVPIVSFVARQHDLRRWLDQAGGVGAEQEALERALQHQSSRFTTIRLGDENLPWIAHQRLLQPRSEAARVALDEAFGRLDRNPRVWDTLRNGINLSDDQRASDSRSFQLTYPFSPALIDTLKSLAGLMQRERTGLKVMQKMLVDHADDLTIDSVIPVGDAFDDLVEGTTSSDPLVAERFRQAKELWRNKLRPYILRQHGESVETPDADLRPSVQWEVRLAKTLLLSALAPNVPALKQLDPPRLAALNHGSIREVLPNDSVSRALKAVREWVAEVPEVKVGAGNNPVITVTLADVGWERVLDRARNEDNDGRRRDLFKDMLFESVGIASTQARLGGVITKHIVWRGTVRDVDWLFGNVRDRSSLADDAFVARPGTVRMILDYPFDESGKDAGDDHARLFRWGQDHARETPTLVWLPTHFTDEENRHLGELVKLGAVLKGENWTRYAEDLSPTDKPIARTILESKQDQLRRQFGVWIQQVYGAAAGRTFPESEPPLVSLTAAYHPGRPVGGSLEEAAQRCATALFDTTYPNHPEFTPSGEAITDAQLTKVLGHLREADARPDHRLALERDQRDLARRVLMPLELAKVNETHLVFTPGEFHVWESRIAQALARVDIDPDGPLQVRDLRHAINREADRRGLTEPMTDLVAAAWALQHRRSWARAGTTVDEPATIRDIRGELELRPQRLPNRDDFDSAVQRYAAWLGGSQATTHLTATNLATFAQTAQEAFRAATGLQRQLADALAPVFEALQVESGPRLALAAELAGLGEDLRRSADPVVFVQRLAEASIHATDSEIGASFAHGAAVLRAVGETRWPGYDVVREHAATGNEVAVDLLADVRNLLAAPEYVREFVSGLRANETRRQVWLESLHRGPVGPPPPPPPSPAPGPGQRPASVTVQAGPGVSPRDAAAMEAAITRAVAAYPGHSFTVTVRKSSA